MKKSEVKLGVKVTNKFKPQFGVGTITKCEYGDDFVGVEYPKLTDGCLDHEINAKEGHGWISRAHDLKVVKEETPATFRGFDGCTFTVGIDKGIAHDHLILLVNGKQMAQMHVNTNSVHVFVGDGYESHSMSSGLEDYKPRMLK